VVPQDPYGEGMLVVEADLGTSEKANDVEFTAAKAQILTTTTTAVGTVAPMEMHREVENPPEVVLTIAKTAPQDKVGIEIATRTIDGAKKIVVFSAAPGSLCESAGLKAEDVLKSINGEAVTSEADAIAKIVAAPGAIAMAVEREGPPSVARLRRGFPEVLLPDFRKRLEAELGGGGEKGYTFTWTKGNKHASLSRGNVCQACCGGFDVLANSDSFRYECELTVHTSSKPYFTLREDMFRMQYGLALLHHLDNEFVRIRVLVAKVALDTIEAALPTGTNLDEFRVALKEGVSMDARRQVHSMVRCAAPWR